MLLVRGRADLQIIHDIVPEYALSAERYFGAEQGQVFIQQARGMFGTMLRIAMRPEAGKLQPDDWSFPCTTP